MVTGNSRITIIGAGPAGCAAALAALSEGSAFTLYEKSRFPRGFVDPFTGSVILAALLTGRLAGQAAARGRRVCVSIGEELAILAVTESVATCRLSSTWHWMYLSGQSILQNFALESRVAEQHR